MKRGNVIMTQFTFDQAHSDIQFQIKHLMVSKVKVLSPNMMFN